MHLYLSSCFYIIRPPPHNKKEEKKIYHILLASPLQSRTKFPLLYFASKYRPVALNQYRRLPRIRPVDLGNLSPPLESIFVSQQRPCLLRHALARPSGMLTFQLPASKS